MMEYMEFGGLWLVNLWDLLYKKLGFLGQI